MARGIGLKTFLLPDEAWYGDDESVFSVAEGMSCGGCHHVCPSFLLGGGEHHRGDDVGYVGLGRGQALDVTVPYLADSVLVELSV